jgi:hypothetical protein
MEIEVPVEDSFRKFTEINSGGHNGLNMTNDVLWHPTSSGFAPGYLILEQHHLQQAPTKIDQLEPLLTSL